MARAKGKSSIVTRRQDDIARRFFNELLQLPRPVKGTLGIVADAICVPAALWTAISLKLGSIDHSVIDEEWLYVTVVAVTVPVFLKLGLYRAVVRFLAPRAVVWMTIGVVLSAAGLAILVQLGVVPYVAFSTLLIYTGLALLYVAGSRLTVRYLMRVPADEAVDRVAIYGAGGAGTQLASALLASGTHRPVFFVDDNTALHGTTIHGLRVLSPAELSDRAVKKRVRRVFLAMPSLSLHRRREIIADLQGTGLHVQTVPDILTLLSGEARLQDVSEVDVADLLGRAAVPPDDRLLGACIRSKCVLVTGAGGSIGSELCRQILALGPKRLLLLEVSEVALYKIERELKIIDQREQLGVEIVPLLGNAHHLYRVREIISTYGAQSVYHAAAYKHVPIVEQNLVEGVHNNIFATWHTAQAALECRVETFVLISTDKAVHPTNVMGATKRMAEIVLQGLQSKTTATRFCMVRFGNVLESSGSVVPLFREQIRRGGPVTVTHPDVIRYFMTIPEAAQLVLQAGSMAQGGDVFVLDMGRPIKILDLARRMVQLAGLSVRDETNPNGDLEIRFTGLRPGEKLYEELLIGKDVTGTQHPMIMRAVEHALGWDEVLALLTELSNVVRRFDVRAAREVLQRAVREYRPTSAITDLVWTERAKALPPATEAESNVTELQARRLRANLPREP